MNYVQEIPEAGESLVGERHARLEVDPLDEFSGISRALMKHQQRS